VTLLTWLLPDPRSSSSWKSPLTVVPELRLHQIPELCRFLIPWTLPVSNRPKMDSRFANRSLIRLLFLCIIRRSAKMYEIHQDFFMNVSFSWNRTFHPEGDSRIFSRIRQIRRFEGVRFLPNSPTLAPRGSGLTPMIWFHEEISNFGKKRHPRNVGVDTRPPKKSQRSYRGVFLKLPPYPYK
jgi:hypothetical protein